MLASTARVLDELAELYVRGREDPEVRFRMRLTERIGLEPVVGELTSLATRSLFSIGSRADELAESLLEDDDLAALRPIEDALDPFIMYWGGGHRIQQGLLAGNLLAGAIAQCMIRRLPGDDQQNIRSVLDEAVDDLKRAVHGDPVNGYGVYGFTGVDLKPGVELVTPWGVLRKAPQVDEERWLGHHGPRSTALFEARRPSAAQLSRDANPSWDITDDDLDSRLALQKGVRELLR